MTKSPQPADTAESARDLNPDEVALYVTPWVSGTRAGAYFGPISTEFFVADEAGVDRVEAWLKGCEELFASIRDKAATLGANAIVGMEISADPFYEKGDRIGLRLHIVGTAARLEALF